MYALDNNSGVSVMPTLKSKVFNHNEPRWFTEGGNGVAPSYPGADWFNIVQAELLNVLQDGGIQPDKTQLNQITTAIRRIVANAVSDGLSGKANASHSHAWNDITNKPSTFSPASHTHTMSQITDFEIKTLTTEDLDSIKKTGFYKQDNNSNATTARHYPDNNKAGVLEVYPSVFGYMQVYRVHDNLRVYARNMASGGTWGNWARLDGRDKANTNHAHTIAQVTGLQAALDEAGTKGLPVGAVVAFPLAVSNPQGFLKCDGSNFHQATYPDLYAALGNKNHLPDLRRSDVGLTAWFPVDAIPSGWIAFDNIATQVTQQSQPELYNLLVAKYGSLANVPKVGDRFIRNAGNGLSVGEKQEDAIRNITGTAGQFNDRANRATSGAFNLTNFGGGSSGLSGGGQGHKITFDASLVVPTANENRPKSIVLKLCIKTKNSLDDVIFWVKAFGAVNNAGAMNASRLGQAIQDKADRTHAHTYSDINNFTQGVANSFIYQKIGNSEIRKFPDGTMIQIQRGNVNINTRIVSKSEVFAVSFTEKPMAMVNVEVSTDMAATISEVSNTGFTITISDMDQGHYVGQKNWQVIAIGRWK